MQPYVRKNSNTSTASSTSADSSTLDSHLSGSDSATSSSDSASSYSSNATRKIGKIEVVIIPNSALTPSERVEKIQHTLSQVIAEFGKLMQTPLEMDRVKQHVLSAQEQQKIEALQKSYMTLKDTLRNYSPEVITVIHATITREIENLQYPFITMDSVYQQCEARRQSFIFLQERIYELVGRYIMPFQRELTHDAIYSDIAQQLENLKEKAETMVNQITDAMKMVELIARSKPLVCTPIIRPEPRYPSCLSMVQLSSGTFAEMIEHSECSGDISDNDSNIIEETVELAGLQSTCRRRRSFKPRA